MGKNYLFVIAIDKYLNPKITPLNNSVLDAENFSEILTQKYSFEIITDGLYDEHATRKNIIEKLNSLSYSVSQDDNLIIYFAGHGELNPLTQKGYWVPYDSSNSISDFVPNSTIIDILAGIDVKHLLLIIDSCFSGSFLSQNRSNPNFHYQKLYNSKSRWVISSGRNEKVSDGSPGVGSPFSIILNAFLQKHIDSTFSVAELAVALSKSVGSISKQQPLFGFVGELGHENGQFVFNLDKANNQEDILDSNALNKIVVSYETAKMLKENGLAQESIFGYYSIGGKTVLKRKDTLTNFDYSAFTYEEILQFIPEEIEVNEKTYIARFDGYDELGELEENTYDFASVTFQKTEVTETPCMAICRCRGRMVAFSKTEQGYYNNLIAWGKNQAETAGIMWKMLKNENKV